jgi:hypothetical protein
MIKERLMDVHGRAETRKLQADVSFGLNVARWRELRAAECQLQHIVNCSRSWVIGNLKNQMLRRLDTGRIRLNLLVPCSIPCTVCHTTQ